MADSILEEREAASVAAALVVKVELRLSMDRFLASDASITDVILPSSEPSLSRSLETVLLRTRGEVWARLAALSIREDEEARASSWAWPMEARETESLEAEEDLSLVEAVWLELAWATCRELELACISELLTALLLRLFSEEEKDFFWTDEDEAAMEEEEASVTEDDEAATVAEEPWKADPASAEDPSIRVICLALKLLASTIWKQKDAHIGSLG